MATERNPFDQIGSVDNIIPINMEEESNVSIEIDPEGDGVIVDFSSTAEMEASEELTEWYEDLTESLPEDELASIAADVVDNFTADKDSRAEWESMFERGFDLLGLKLVEGS